MGQRLYGEARAVGACTLCRAGTVWVWLEQYGRDWLGVGGAKVV